MVLAELFDALPLVADGAVGTLLDPGDGGTPVESRNLTDADSVRAVHEAFATAGAVCHRTNTRAGGRRFLTSYGMEERCEAVHTTGAALVREAAGNAAVLMGALSLLPTGSATAAEAERHYGEQVVYLSDTGCEFFLLEHVDDVQAACTVLELIARNSDAPVLVQLRATERARLASGQFLREAADTVVTAGAAALGIGCGMHPAAIEGVLPELLPLGLPLAVLAGIARPDRPAPYTGAPVWQPRAFADALSPLATQGVSILGGCCHVTPRHIRALSGQLGKVPASAATSQAAPQGTH